MYIDYPDYYFGCLALPWIGIYPSKLWESLSLKFREDALTINDFISKQTNFCTYYIDVEKIQIFVCYWYSQTQTYQNRERKCCSLNIPAIISNFSSVFNLWIVVFIQFWIICASFTIKPWLIWFVKVMLDVLSSQTIWNLCSGPLLWLFQIPVLFQRLFCSAKVLEIAE